MRIYVAVMVVAALVALCTSAACAGSNDNWRISMTLYDEAHYVPSPATFGTDSAASDGLDSLDQRAPTAYIPETAFIVSDRPDLGGTFIEEYRAPLQAGESKTWHLLIPDGGAGSLLFQLRLWNPVQYDINGAFHVKLLSGSLDLMCVWDPAKNGTMQNPAYTFSVQRGSSLYLTAGPAPAVPEPASVASLAMGIVGVPGLLCLRKK